MLFRIQKRSPVRLGYLGVDPGSAAAHFTDVPSSHPFYPYIQKIYDAGITSGCSTDPPKFCPDDTVTRGQLAVFLARAMDAHSGGTPAAGATPDPGSTAGWTVAGYTITPTMAIGGALVLVALLRLGR